MSIERFADTYIAACDGCGEELPPEYDFYDAVDAKKAAGWKSVKEGSEWFDLCPNCHSEVKGAAADFSEVGPCNP
ncbi:hypothetical protein LJC34_02615 [Oscillospiraceae bacterium OttesenSCG-928-G22]|nr:hypothetical protein [Oscillospiraceae bacterium OttesenSCG-928-G22]